MTLGFPQLENVEVLITGGAGFVGSNLVKLLLSNVGRIKITVIDNLLSSEKTNLPSDSRLEFLEGSISNDTVVDRVEDSYDYIFHLATFHGNQNSIFDPLSDHENNTLTTLKLFNRIKEFKKVKKVVYSSAGCSVAKKTFSTARATTEEDPVELMQDSPYSISKIIGEFYSVYFYNRYHLPTVRARFQNVYGPGEVLGAGKWRGTYATVWRNVIPTFMYKAIRKEALPVDNGGIATRDFIYVDDICKGLISCALNGKPGDVYNLATGKETTVLELAKLINKITGNNTPIALKPKRDWDNSGKRYASTEKSRKVLHFEAKTSLEDGLTNTHKWTFENLVMIEKHINKHKIRLETVI